MDKKTSLQLYEKLYFHEMEAREKLNSRLQTSLTLIVAFAGVLAYLLQNYAPQTFAVTPVLFAILI